MSKRILITGGAGFLGSHIARALLTMDAKVILLDAFVQYFSPLETVSTQYQRYIEERFRDIRGRVSLIRGDTRNADDLRRAIAAEEPTHIIHLAALPIANMSSTFSDEAVGSIVSGTINLLEIIRDIGCVQRFVYASSSMVYGDFEYMPADEKHPTNPKSIYGAAKLCGETMTKVYGQLFDIDYAIVRPSAVYGPTDVNHRVSQIFVENAVNGKPLMLHGGDTALDFTFVTDIADGFIKAAIHPKASREIFNITRGEGRTLRELAGILAGILPDVEIIEKPSDKAQPKRGALDITKARDLLGYKPKYRLEEGIARYVDFIQACREK